MGDVGDAFAGWKEDVQAHRKRMLEKADTSGWTQHTPFHFSRMFGDTRVNWWPSGGKAQIGSRMVYGHKKVAAALKKLANSCET